MSYALLSRVYEKFIGIDYTAAAKFIDREFKANGSAPDIVLDIGCGTGALTHTLCNMGYSMIAADPSEEMLSLAAEALRGKNTPLICQRMSELDLYGTVDAAVCTTDVINHITDSRELERSFKRLALFTVKDGIFIFDINTEYKFRELYATNCYYYENSTDCLVWQNSYDEDSGICQFDLTLFSAGANGAYSKMTDSFEERYYSPEYLTALLERSGFDVIKICGGEYEDRALEPGDGRAVFVARKKWQAGAQTY